MRLLSLFVLGFAVSTVGAAPFVPQVTPKGWSKDPTEAMLVAKGGKLTPLGQYYFDLASDPAKFAAYVRWNFDPRSRNFHPWENPVYRGTNQDYQIHRFLATIPGVAALLKKSALPPTKTSGLCNEAWRTRAAETFAALVNERGLFAAFGNEANMACQFHLTRTGLWPVVGKEGLAKIYSIGNAQKLTRTLLSAPDVFNADDQWLRAPAAYLAERAKVNAKTEEFSRFLDKNGCAFWTGGLMIGWKDKPSLHATWDGLAILNILYRMHPEPDPASPRSIFYLWNQQPAAAKERTRRGFALLTQRLWMDFRDHGGASYCHIVKGRPEKWSDEPGGAPLLSDHAAYPRKDSTWWALLCWEEIFGEPRKSSRNGCQALLKILGLPSGLR